MGGRLCMACRRVCLCVSNSVPVDFSRGRVHYINITLLPSSYLDSTALNSPVGVRTVGYRAGFAGYTAYADPTTTQVRHKRGLQFFRSSKRPFLQASDTLVISWSVGSLVLNTERTLRLGILQVCPYVLRGRAPPPPSHSPPRLCAAASGYPLRPRPGDARGLQGLPRALRRPLRLHDAGPARRARVLPLQGARRDRYALTAGEVLTTRGMHAASGTAGSGGDEEDYEGGTGFGGVGLGFYGGPGGGHCSRPPAPSHHEQPPAPTPTRRGWVRTSCRVCPKAPPPPPGVRAPRWGLRSHGRQ